MKSHILLIVAGLLTACQPVPTASTPNAGSVQLTASQTRIARIAIGDALDRIVPRLSSVAAKPLASSLADLLATLSDGGVDRAVLAEASLRVMQFDEATGTNAAELDVIRLALATMQR